MTTNNTATIAKLDQELEREYCNRLNTAGHGRRARIQATIDALERELAALVSPAIGILQRGGRQVFYVTGPLGSAAHREFDSFSDCRAWVECRLCHTSEHRAQAAELEAAADFLEALRDPNSEGPELA